VKCLIEWRYGSGVEYVEFGRLSLSYQLLSNLRILKICLNPQPQHPYMAKSFTTSP